MNEGDNPEKCLEALVSSQGFIFFSIYVILLVHGNSMV